MRKLVTSMCANYDKEYGGLPLDSESYANIINTVL
ncbi:cysteine-rich VLP protein [Bianquea renquensis]